MKFENLNTESLSNNELLEIFGGKQDDPHGIFQWLGYGIAATVDKVGTWLENLPKYQQSSGSALMNTALH